jgi:hypothetical protein
MCTPHAALLAAYLQLMSERGPEPPRFKRFVQEVTHILLERDLRLQLSLCDVLDELKLSERAMRCRMLGVQDREMHAVKMPLLSFALSFMMHERAMLHTMAALHAKQGATAALCAPDGMGRIALHWAVSVPCVYPLRQAHRMGEPIEHALPVVYTLLSYYEAAHKQHWFGIKDALRMQDQNGHTPLHVLIHQKHALRTPIGHSLASMGANVEAVLPYMQAQEELPKTIHVLCSGALEWKRREQTAMQQRATMLMIAMQKRRGSLGRLNADLLSQILRLSL